MGRGKIRQTRRATISPHFSVLGHEALAKQFNAVQLRFCAASAVISGQLPQQGSTKIFAGPHGLVARDSPCRVLLPKLGIFERGNDGGGTAGGDQVAALARVICAIGGDGSDLLVGRDLFQ
jgi:hypothetical protein